MVSILPFRYRLLGDRQGPTVQTPGAGIPRSMLVEIALSTTGAASPYLPLRRDFVIDITASLALLVAMAVFWIRLQSYLRGRRLAELLSHLLQVITTFAASGELADDCTALAIRCRRSLFAATPPIRD